MMNHFAPYRFFGLLVLLSVTAGCHRAPPPDLSLGTPTVSVSKPVEREVDVFEEYTGRVNAVASVDIRARVTGYIMDVKFRDGDFVKENEVLYKIDDTTYKADLERAQGDVKRLQAQADLLAIQVDRYKKLVEKKAASQQELDEYLGKQAENVGSTMSAKANLEIAEANLKWTEVRSPIAGRVSKTNLTKGNLVTANATQLTTVVSYDPIYISFNMEEPVLIRIQKLIREGKVKVEGLPKIEMDAGLTDDVQRKYPFHGLFNFADNQVDASTGTITVRARFANRDRALVPGMFARVRIPVGLQHKGLLITDRAIGTDQGQKFVYIVDESNKVQYRRVRLGPVSNGLREIEEGVLPTDRVIVEGLQRVRPGIEVKPEEVRIEKPTDRLAATR